MYRTKSLSIYHHIPLYTFNPTIKSGSNSPNSVFTFTHPLSKSKSESNLLYPQKSVIPSSDVKKPDLPPLEPSSSLSSPPPPLPSPPPLPPKPHPSNTRLNEINTKMVYHPSQKRKKQNQNN
ncbi:hypothetical protein PIROE2DRAFT_64470 [Piromyces sp. E2]|nr:hypothetical protein PIROE2DRAFT_64470 [Piromyces sp. E2]|eukprot:OUM58350.1 hypothetical protein PIROE2DRAFT_64470 [Piromyces sp. E2]